MSPSWKRDPETGEWVTVERPRWAPGPGAKWRRYGGPPPVRPPWLHRAQVAVAWGIPVAVAILVALTEDGR